MDIGKSRRLNRILCPSNKRTVIVPLDDIPMSGPEGELRDPSLKLKQVLKGKPNAIIGFKGLFVNNSKEIIDVGCIMNLTMSTTRSTHTRKVLISSVEEALKLDMNAVAVHINISSIYETEMLKILGEISKECSCNGMPLVAFMYPRTENKGIDENYYDLRESDQQSYATIVRHAARVGVDLGADMIKTQYTGSQETFHTVVECCGDIPIVIAGGPVVDLSQLMTNAFNAIQAGAAGVSIGRNVFLRNNSHQYVTALNGIVHDNWSIHQAICHVNSNHNNSIAINNI